MGHTDKHAAKHGVSEEDDLHGVIDHGSIQGLGDDDHSQYLLADGTRALSGEISAGSNKITSLGDGTAASQDASTVKQMEDYVSAIVQAMVSKDNVIAATTGALPANTRTGDVLTASANGAFPTIDGIAAALNQEYLVKDEGGVASHINDGIYTLTTLGDAGTPWALTRRADLDAGDSAAGAFLAVEQGTVNGDATFRCINNAGTDVVNTDVLEFKYWGATIDHGNLLGLADDDHSQYHNDTRGDARYFQQSEHINSSAGAGDAGKPVKLDADGQIDATMVNDADIDHGTIGGLADDDHTQYHNDARGDDRYYTETELDGGQLDNRYFTETEHLNVSAGAGDAGKPIKLDAAGHVDSTMVNDADISHDNIANQRTSGAFNLHLKADVTLAGTAPVQTDFTGWAVGETGMGIGTDSTVWLVRKTGATAIVCVQLT